MLRWHIMEKDTKEKSAVNNALLCKLNELRSIVRAYGRAAVAFSGGTDSALLLKTVHEELGSNAVAVTAESCFMPATDIKEAAAFCGNLGIRHEIIKTAPLSLPAIEENTPERCYFCKKLVFSAFLDLARRNNIPVVCDGSNADDTADYRPGMKALKELGVRSPLLDCGLHKVEIRQLLHESGLTVWKKPSAACLASRVPYNEKITREKLSMAERGEAFLHDLGLSCVRVRVHSGAGYLMARIEVMPSEIPFLLEKRSEIYAQFKKTGFSYTSLDIAGYRTGSLNEVLRDVN